MIYAALASPYGPLRIAQQGAGLVALDWCDGPRVAETPLLQEALDQLEAYLAGRLTAFDLPLAPAGSAALLKVLDQISAIPFGETVTYGEIAARTGLSAQAVGQLCGANPLPILIPCHRVMGAKGLTGFSGAGGVETKVALLRHEGAGGFLI